MMQGSQFDLPSTSATPMPDLLLELRSEEIPARMQRKAAGDLKARVTNALVEAGLLHDVKVGRELLFVNHEFLSVLTRPE